ncbi:MAG: UvrB/UvrC motif-containing protein [Elusimicrobiota bacterium]|jgi:protein arginine kinase activator
MLCSNCHKNEASVLFKQIIDNQVTQSSLCAQCAQAAELPGMSASPLFDLLAQLGGGRKPVRGRETTCRSCGLRYEEFRRTGMLGCADCYTSFAAKLERVLQSVHGSLRHGGKMPQPAADRPASARATENAGPQILRAKLQAALKAEDYEEAARLRDRLRDLEKR